jgi:hypothetical protein
MGVDHVGNLWMWDKTQDEVVSVTPGGKRVKASLGGAPGGIDADREWGIATLDSAGTSMSVRGWDGVARVEIGLPESAAGICWIGRDSVAVAPRFAAYRVGIWDLTTKKLEQRIGPVPVIDEHAPGARFARVTLLRYDFTRHELVAMDACSGELAAYSDDGKVLRHVTVPHPKRESTDAWLAKLDADYKQQGQAFLPLVWSFSTMALRPDGTAWVAEASSPHDVTLAVVSRSGDVEHKTISTTCPSVRLGIWQNSFIFFRDPESSLPYCIESRSLE